jgi:hypothetical protein
MRESQIENCRFQMETGRRETGRKPGIMEGDKLNTEDFEN